MNNKIRAVTIVLVSLTLFIGVSAGVGTAQFGDGIGDDVGGDDGIGDNVGGDDGVGDNVEDARDEAEDTRDEAEDTSDDLRDEAEDTSDDLRDETEDTRDEAEDTSDDLRDEAEDTRDEAEETSDDLRDEAEDARDEATEAGNNLQDEVEDRQNDARNSSRINDLRNNVDIEGAAFTAPESIQNEVESLQQAVPDGAVSHAFVLASSDQLYIVLTDEEPVEGYASVQGRSLDLSSITLSGSDQTQLDLEPVRAAEVEFQEPSQVSVEEVYQNTETYDREYVEFDANHRSIAVDYEETDYAATMGVLVDDPISPTELFGTVGEQSHSTLNEFDADNVGSVLGDISRPHVVTTSYDTEYWENTGVTMSGIVASPATPAAEFIQNQQEYNALPVDSRTPLLYVIDKQYEAQSVSTISEISEDPAAYDGETVRFESNLFMTTVSSKRVAESATGTKLPPVDTVLHGGVAWDQLPEDRGDLISVMAASSIEQTELARNRSGTYEVTGEIISTERLDGEYPHGSILIAYDIERKGSVRTASVGDLIRGESSSVSSVLRQQANPEIEQPTVDTSVEEVDDAEDTTEQSPEDVSEESGTESNTNPDDTDEESGSTTDSQSSSEQDGSEPDDGITKVVVDIITNLFGIAQSTLPR